MRRRGLVLAGLAAVFLTTPAQATTVADWQAEITLAAQRCHLPPSWIAAVMAEESGGHLTAQGRLITSAKGAMGLMQIMPQTWADLRADLSLGGDPYDPHDNIVAGAAYLRRLYDRFGYPNLFAAYNAGPQIVALGNHLPAETRAYVARVTARIGGDAAAHASVFVPLTPPISQSPGARLFIPVSAAE